MYYASYAGSIIKAGMDGSHATLIVSGLEGPQRIVVDYGASRLYWIDGDASRILSSNLANLAGGNIQTAVELAAFTGFQGLMLENKLYWGNWGAKSILSGTKMGENVRKPYTAYNGVGYYWQLGQHIT